MLHLWQPSLLVGARAKKGKLAALVASEELSTRVNPLQLLSVMLSEQPVEKIEKGHLYVVNGINVQAMVETGATNSFIS